MEPRRLGYAYSVHGVGGNLGYALAPIVSFGLGSAFGWRIALVAMGVIGLVVLGVLATQRHLLTSQRAHDAHSHTLRGSFGLFVQPAILLCFFYFVFQTTASIGLQTFVPAGLNTGFDVPLVLATSAVTAYLLGGAAGIVAGGFLAVRTTRHDRVAGVGLLGARDAGRAGGHRRRPAAADRAGFRPHRRRAGGDRAHRAISSSATPRQRGAAGRVYGFVYSEPRHRRVARPDWFGLMLDHQLAREMFYTIAALLVIAIATVVNVRRAVVARA